MCKKETIEKSFYIAVVDAVCEMLSYCQLTFDALSWVVTLCFSKQELLVLILGKSSSKTLPCCSVLSRGWSTTGGFFSAHFPTDATCGQLCWHHSILLHWLSCHSCTWSSQSRSWQNSSFQLFRVYQHCPSWSSWMAITINGKGPAKTTTQIASDWPQPLITLHSGTFQSLF